jgi:hypothetical protein
MRHCVSNVCVDERRERVLGRTDWFSPPDEGVLAAVRGELPDAVRYMKAQLAGDGLAIVDFDRALDCATLRELAGHFGAPIPERDEAVQPFVVDDVVLCLEPRCAPDSQQLRPFSSSWIGLHSEGSRWARAERPTFLLLQCLAPPSPDCGGQTLLRDVQDLVARLQPASADVLRHTTLSPRDCDTPVLSDGGDGAILTFRDPVDEPAEWSSPCPASDVQAALLDLLACAYEPASVRGVHWRRNRVVIFANRRFLHGRSRMTEDSRALQRVRIL